MKLSKQQTKVYNYLKCWKKATVRDLFALVNYPTCVIRDLRKKGIKITNKEIENVNYIEYILED